MREDCVRLYRNAQTCLDLFTILVPGLKVHVQYFVSVADFEIVLDSAGEPVPSAAVKLLNPDELGYQR